MELGGLDDDFSEMIQAQKKMEVCYSSVVSIFIIP